MCRTGSGCVLSFLSELLGKDALLLGTDINAQACLASSMTAVLNSAFNADFVRTDLLLGLEIRCAGLIDLVVFNPPYVPTDECELAESMRLKGVASAWSGGADGVEVVSRLFPKLKQLLRPGGCLYLVAIKQNKPWKLSDKLTKQGFEVQVLFLLQAHFSHSQVDPCKKSWHGGALCFAFSKTALHVGAVVTTHLDR